MKKKSQTQVYKLKKQIKKEILPLRVINNDLDAQLNKWVTD